VTSFQESIQPTIANLALTNALNQLVAEGAILENALVFLFTAGPSPAPLVSVLSDWTQPTFTGSAPEVITWLPSPVNLPSNLGIGVTGHVDFLCTAVTPPGDVVLGYGVVQTPGGSDDDVLLVEYFADPVAIAAIGDLLSLDVVLPMANKVIVRTP